MSSPGMELSILKLTSPRKRLGQSARFSFDNDPAQLYGTSNCSFSPKGKTTGGNSAAPWFADDDLFTIFEQHQHRAAIPFKWETIPGTRIDQKSFTEVESSKILKKGMSDSESQMWKEGMSDSEEQDMSLTSSPVFSLSPSSSTNSTRSSSSRSSVESPVSVRTVPTKFQINSIQIPSSATLTEDDFSGDDDGKVCMNHSSKFVDKSVGNSGQLLPLKPPPGMHSIKELLSLETEDRNIIASGFSSRSVNSLISSSTTSNSSAITNVKSYQRRSFRRDGLKALPFVSSAPKNHSDDFLNNLLGMEEWAKVVKKQEKEEKHQQQEESGEITGRHQRALSMPRLSFAFKKKSTTDKESSTESLEIDSFFNDDFGKKGGLRERRPLSSVSSRSFSDVHTPSKSKNWVFDNDADYSDDEVDARGEHFGTRVIAEEDVKEQLQNVAKNNDVSITITQVGAKEKRKNDALGRLRRIFNLSNSRSSSSGDPFQLSYQKPARLSSVSPAPPPPLAPTRSELSLKKVSQNQHLSKTVTASPILKMCSALPFSRAILRNVRQLRSFELHNSRALTSK